jgi:hypothetical protein
LKKLPKASVAGEQHKKARSFSAKEVRRYEETKVYRDQSIAWIFPTRGAVPIEVVDAWDMIAWPMNQSRSFRLSAKALEVASAYNILTRICTDKKAATAMLNEGYAEQVLGARFILTTEEDNIVPPYGVQQLLSAIFTCPDCKREIAAHCAGRKKPCKNCREWRCEKGHKGYDGVSGLYSVKSNPPIPMAFGDPKKPNDFKPRSVARALKSGSVIEVNGIAMGFALFRKDIFRQVSKPWFDTASTHTQDIFFCQKAKAEAGARFGVHCGVLVGHLDVNSGEVI